MGEYDEGIWEGGEGMLKVVCGLCFDLDLCGIGVCRGVNEVVGIIMKSVISRDMY